MQAAQLSVESAQTAMPRWSLATRIAFRFFCPYLGLYYLGTLLSTVRFMVKGPSDAYRRMLHLLNIWVATHIFHLSPAIVVHRGTGSTDTALDYIQNLFILVISAAIAIVWSGLDRKRPDYRTLHSWLRLMVRYSLAFSLFTYGFMKVFPQQMPPAWLYMSKLVQPFGDKSPQALLWSFMGFSTPYQIFCGAAEVIAATLLLFRRTTTLGALVSIGVLLNVVMVNLCYDVSVKLFSINLLLAAVFLAAPDFTKLARFFVLNRPMEPAEASGPTFHRRWLATTVVAFKLLFITANLYQSGSYWYERYQSQMAHPPRPALYGLYDVEAFIQNGHERLALTTDPTRWRRVIIDFFPPKVMQVQMMDDSFRPYQVEYDKAGESVTVIPGTESSKKYRLECSRPDADHLVMQGMLASDSLTVRMKRMDPSKFFLLGRGFEWIQEAPVSR